MAEAAGPSAADLESRPFILAILAALIYEVRPFLRAVKARRRKDINFPAWEFPVGEGRGVVALSGVGEAAARRAAAQLLTVCRPQVFLSMGFGGGLTPEVQPGSIIVGSSFWHYSPKSGAVREVSPPVASHSRSDLIYHLTAAGVPALAGSIVTTPAIIAKARHLEAFQHLTHPVLDQETSAAAEVAASHRVAFLGVRAVTDAAGEEIPDFIAEAIAVGKTPGPIDAVKWLCVDIKRILPLARLWQRSRIASQHLARALMLLSPKLSLDRK